jgi:hypothetical protein
MLSRNAVGFAFPAAAGLANDTECRMDRRASWFMPLVLALSPALEAAEPGFYVGATASRVEQDVDGGRVIAPFAIITPPPGETFPIPIPDPICCLFRPVPPPLSFGGSFFIPGNLAPDRVDVDDGQAGWSITLGYRINKYLAAELAYVDYGDAEITEHFTTPGSVVAPPLQFTRRYDLGTSGPAVSVLGALPLGAAWQLFIRGGVLFADQEIDLAGASGSNVTFGDEVLLAGAGVQWSFASRWSARLEYQRTGDLRNSVTSDNLLEQASLSVLFNL